jgi:hypothetical protein
MEDERENEPIDLSRRRVVRELHNELGGLFGIGATDIEAAVERLWTAIQSGEYAERYGEARLPPTLQTVIHYLDCVYEHARRAADEADAPELEHIADLLTNYARRVQRLRDGLGQEP